MIDCPRGEVRDLLPDLLHDRLDAGSRSTVEAHIAGCLACSSELALLRSARAVGLRGTPAIDVEQIARGVRTSRTRASAPILHGSRGRRVPVWAMSMAAALMLLVAGTLAVLYYEGGTGVDPRGTGPVAGDATPRSGTGVDPELAFAMQGGLLIGALADLDESELESMLQFLPALDPYPDEEPATLIQGFNAGEG